MLALAETGKLPYTEFSHGAAVNVQEKRHGFTPLIQAVEKNDKNLVKLLLVHGADTSLRMIDGRSALDRAEASGSVEIVSMLKRARGRK